MNVQRVCSRIFLLIFISFVVGFSSPFAFAGSKKVRLSGMIESNLFLGLLHQNQGGFFNYRNTNVFVLRVEPVLSEQLSGRAEVQLRNINFSKLSLATDLENYNNPFPVSVRLTDAYIDFFGLIEILNKDGDQKLALDLRVGQQRIAWGAATAFNPTDVINPYNLENPLDFTARVPVTAVKATLYFGESVTLTLVGVPFFTAPVLPVSLFKDVFVADFPIPIPDGFSYHSTERLIQPKFQVENMQGGARLAFEAFDTNVSISYFFGRMFIPSPLLALIKTFVSEIQLGGENNVMKVDSFLVFARQHVIGLDFTRSVFGIGVWFEAALYIPEAVTLEMSFLDSVMELLTKAQLGVEKLPSVAVVQDKPYPKITAGLDYTFPGGWYFNLQYVYGFFNEVSADKIHHYAFLIFRKPFWRGKLLLQLTSAYEIDATVTSGEKKDGSSFGKGFLLNPELQYKPFDSSAIVLGGVFARGQKGTTFLLFQELAQVYARFRMKF